MKAIFINLFLVLSISAYSQNVLTGLVTNENDEPLIFATVNWENTEIAVTTDLEGNFEIERPDVAANLVVSYVGYTPVTVLVDTSEESVWVEVSGVVALTEVEVKARQSGNFTSTLEIQNLESITSQELRKAPCCNLGESFETNASVDVAYADAITGSKEIQMLGLRGVYTQLLIEKRPALYGLAAPYALDYIAGTWLSGIQISKGAGTVQTGYGGMAGAINSELQKPREDKRFFVNLFGSHVGRGEANVHLNRKINDKWSIGTLLHGSIFKNEVDHNNDGFLSMPQKEVGTGMVRLFYNGNDPFEGQLNVQVLKERRTAGQIIDDSKPLSDFYTINQNNDRVEVTGKLGYLGFDEPYKAAGSIWSATYHKLNSRYGNRYHRGEQRSFYSNLFYSSIIGSTDHKVMYGGGYQYDDYREFVDEADISRTEHKTGAFAEYTYSGKNPESGWWSDLGLILGLRADYHNQFGLLVTPRMNFKLNFTEESVVRISGGRGFRTANVIAENIGFLASSRQIVFVEDLDIESSWNYGANFTQKFKIAGREGAFVADAYRTEFTNQVILDVEENFRDLMVYNLQGESFSNSFLTSFNWEVLKGFELKLAYKFNDVRTTYRGENLRERPLVAKHRGLIAADYETPNKKWRFNVSSQLVGQQRLQDINVHLPDEEFHYHENGDRSPRYALVNAQMTFAPKKNLEFYAGGENLTGYHQHQPIIGASDPFGSYFDATRVYAPTMGTVGYFGLRYSIE